MADRPRLEDRRSTIRNNNNDNAQETASAPLRSVLSLACPTQLARFVPSVSSCSSKSMRYRTFVCAYVSAVSTATVLI